MDPVTMGLMGSSALSSVGNIFGGMMGSTGAAQTNASQIAAGYNMQNNANNFTAQQGDIARDYNTVAARDQRDWQAQQNLNAMTFGSDEAGKNRQWQAEQAQKSMDFTRDMSNTAWQRGMADMKAAGLNPILAAGTGGASTPSGAMGSGGQASGTAGGSGAASSPGASGASGSVGTLHNPGAAMGAAVSSAAQIGKNVLDLKSTQQGIEESKARAAKDASAADLNRSAELVNKEEQLLKQEFQRKAAQDTATSAAQARNADASAVYHGAAAGEAGTRSGLNVQNTERSKTETANERIRSYILQNQGTSAKAQAEIDRKRADAYQGPGIVGDTMTTTSKIGTDIKQGARSIIDSVMDIWKNRNEQGGIFHVPMPSHDRPAR